MSERFSRTGLRGHLSFLALYFIAAGIAIVLLPEVLGSTPPANASLIAALVFVLAAFAHSLYVHMEHRRRTDRQIEALRQAQRRILTAFDETLHESNTLRADLERKGEDGDRRVSSVVAEVKVLQNLIESFYTPPDEGGEVVGASMASPPIAHGVARGAGEAAGAGRATSVGRTAGVGHDTGVESPDDEKANAGAYRPVPLAMELSDSEIVHAVKSALRQERVDVHLQRIVSLPQRKTRFYECFTRIRDDRGFMLMPDQFIGIAEREGLVRAIDNLQLFRCVQLIRRTQHRRFDTGFFCNISPLSLADPDFFADFLQFMAANDDLASKMIFELRQEDVNSADGLVLEHMGRLAALGFRLSMDQVSDLDLDVEQLLRRHIRFVKVEAAQLLLRIEQEFDVFDPRILKHRLDLAGIDLIIQNIESERQVVELLDYNVDFGQGYLFGEPRLSRDD